MLHCAIFLWEILFLPVNIGEIQGQQSPNEFAVDFGYSRLLSETFSGAVAMRYIRSDLTGGQLVNGVETKAGNSFAVDVAFYYLQRISKKP